MKGLINWATTRARMTVVFIVMSIVFGTISYISLPKEGEPDIEIPALFVSIPAPGISAQDAETLIVKPLESRLSGLNGLDEISGTAADNYGGIALLFDFGWDRDAVIAEVREEMSQAESILPDIIDDYSINEINFSEFPIAIVSLSGSVPERSLVKLAEEMQDEIQSLSPVLSADLAGARDEVLEVIIDLEKIESYDVTVNEIYNTITANNRLVAAGAIEKGSGRYAIKIPSSFTSAQDVQRLPVKVSGDRVITIGDLADMRLTFADPEGTARLNGEPTLAIQVVKRKGENLIDTVAQVRETMERVKSGWPENVQAAVDVQLTNDTSVDVNSMVKQLESSVITAIILVMLAVLAALGPRSAMLVGFAIPTSFMLTFALLAVFGITISNIVMFGLILAVGMLVDGAIVVVEYADQEINQGTGPMRAYVAASKRMFWPIISSTATTLCAFVPLLFWPGIAGQFMGNLPRTIIFVLSASLVVALIFLPVMGGVAGRVARLYEAWSSRLYARGNRLIVIIGIFAAFGLAFLSLQIMFRLHWIVGILVLIMALSGISIFMNALSPPVHHSLRPYERSRFGRFIYGIVSSPWRVAVTLFATLAALGFILFLNANFGKGVEFFPDGEAERLNIYVQARGNLSVEEKDRLTHEVEDRVRNVKGVETVFAFGGDGGLNQNTGGGEAPIDTIGTIQIELAPWQERYEWPDGSGRGAVIIEDLRAATEDLPGIKISLLDLARGPASAKPINIRLLGNDFTALEEGIRVTRERLIEMGGIKDIEDTTPLPGIDYQVRIDTTQAGRYGATVADVGTMMQLVSNGITVGQIRLPNSDDEIDIDLRLPESERLVSTLGRLRVRTPVGLVPISNFTESEPVEAVSTISRRDQKRYFNLSADTQPGVNATQKLNALIDWFDEGNLPKGVTYELAGDFADQAESQAFLMKGFLASLGLMMVILLAQFNSFYNSVLVLTAVIFSTFGVLLGLVIMQQPFSIIMTGTGVLALAGIIVNNNIILIDAFQEFREEHPLFEAITRTAESRIRPILLTTGTTVLGVLPMMLGISIDFANGGYTIDAPTSLWWKPLATAIVFGLTFASVLTLIVTPTFLALPYWVGVFFRRVRAGMGNLFGARRDLSLVPAVHQHDGDYHHNRAAE